MAPAGRDGWPPRLWLLDASIPLAARGLALRLLKVRIRQAWMRVDPYMILTAIAAIVALRIAFRATGLEVSVANLLTGTAVVVIALAVPARERPADAALRSRRRAPSGRRGEPVG